MRSLAALGACLLALLASGVVSANSGVLTNATGDTAVATFSLGQGDVVDYTWSSGSSVTMHINQAGGAEVFNTTSMATHGSWTAPAAGQYTFSFRSSGGYGYNVISWDITPKTNPITFVAIGGGIAAVVAGIVAGVAISSRRKKAAQAPPMQQMPPPPTQ